MVTADHFGDPPATEPRRVVVTGLGLVSPLGVGVQRSWEALLAGHVGTQALAPEHLPEVIQLPCAAAVVRLKGAQPILSLHLLTQMPSNTHSAV